MIVPFIPAHLDGFKVFEWMGHIQDKLKPGYAEALSLYPSYSMVIEGSVIACGGAIPTGDHKYMAWALMGENTAPHMLPLTREILNFFSLFEAKRIEAHVRSDFKQGIRWMNILGFQCETPEPMKYWGDDEMDYFQFSRVKA